MAVGVPSAAGVDCAAAGDAVAGGRAAADAPPHAAAAQATASALAARNVCLIMLPSMRRPASGCPCGSLNSTVTIEAIGVNERDMKLARPRPSPVIVRPEMALMVVAATVHAFLHVAVMLFP